MSINVQHLSYKYPSGKDNVIKDLNLSIEDGTITVLLGLNGCGKTTFIKLLAGLLKADSGEILYADKNVFGLSMKERSKIFAYVPQKTYSADDYFVKDYLTYGFINSLKFYQTPSNEQLAKVQDIAEKLSITHLLSKKMGQISGGERQIVSIASCLLQDTPIILLDEPTSALDLKNQNIVLSLLREITKDGKTIILSSHNPNHALFLESNVVLMDKGTIIKQGTSKDIVKVEVLKEIYGNNICLSENLIYKEISFK